MMSSFFDEMDQCLAAFDVCKSFGVPEHVHEKVNVRLTIPMIKEKRSLNLSTSVSMVLGEQIRQFSQY